MRSGYNRAEVAEQADALRSGRSGLYARVGSTPTFGTKISPPVALFMQQEGIPF